MRMLLVGIDSRRKKHPTTTKAAGIAIKNNFVAAVFWNAEAIGAARHWRGIDHDQNVVVVEVTS